MTEPPSIPELPPSVKDREALVAACKRPTLDSLRKRRWVWQVEELHMFVKLFSSRGEGLKKHTDLNHFMRGDVANSTLPYRKSFSPAEIDVINNVGRKVASALIKAAYEESDGIWNNMPNKARLTWQHLERQKDLPPLDPRFSSLWNLALLEADLNSSWNGCLTATELSFFAPSSPAIGDAVRVAREVMASDTQPTTICAFEEMALQRLSSNTFHDASCFTPRCVLAEHDQDLVDFRTLYTSRVVSQIHCDDALQQQVNAKWGVAKTSKTHPIQKGQRDVASMFMSSGPSQPGTPRASGSIMELPERKFGIRFQSGTIEFLEYVAGGAKELSKALASYFKRVQALTEAQAEAVKTLLNARKNGIGLVIFNAVPAAGKTEVIVMASTTAILLDPKKEKQVAALAPMKTSAHEILERYDAHGLGFIEAFFKKPENKKTDVLSNWSCRGSELFKKLLKSQNNHSFVMYVMRMRWRLQFDDEKCRPGQPYYKIMNDEDDAIDDLSAREEKLSEITHKTRESVSKDPEIARFLACIEFLFPEQAGTERALRACVCDAHLEDWCTSFSIDSSAGLDALSIGRLLFHLMTERRIGKHRTLCMDDGKESPIMANVFIHGHSFETNAIFVAWKNRQECPGAPAIFSRFANSPDPNHCKTVSEFATTFFRIPDMAAAIGPSLKRVLLAGEVRRLRKKALAKVSNGAAYPSGDNRTFPFKPEYEEYVTDDDVSGLMVNRWQMIDLMRMFDNKLINNHEITWEMAQFAVYSQPLTSNREGLDGRTFKLIDEGEAHPEKMLSLVESQVTWELKKPQENRAVVVVSGQPEQAILGFTGAYGDFGNFFTNSTIIPDNIFNLTLNENLASSRSIVQMYNTIAPRCGTYGALIAKPGPSPPDGPLPLIHHRFINDNIKWSPTNTHPNVYEWVVDDVSKQQQVWEHAVEEGIRFCRTELDNSRDLPLEIALLMRKNTSSKELKELERLWEREFAKLSNIHPIPKLVVMTQHKSLGQRFEFVVVAGLYARDFYVAPHTEEEIHDAYKLLLVACSRPKRGLTILMHHTAKRRKDGTLIRNAAYRHSDFDELFPIPTCSTRSYRVIHAEIPQLLAHPQRPSENAESAFRNASRKRKA